jgi:hypothetical protein
VAKAEEKEVGVIMRCSILLVGCLGCASSPVQSIILSEPAPRLPKITVTTIDPPKKLPAGKYLGSGLSLYVQKQYQQASGVFQSAIETGDLNDAGRALAYWHIAQCWSHLDDKDLAAEAYHSFAFVAQDILDMREQRRFAVAADGRDFVSHFKVEKKLAEARAYVNAVWATRDSSYGRSLDDPVVANNTVEINAFVAVLMNFCEGACKRVCDLERVKLNEGTVERIAVSHCEGFLNTFFVVVGER